MRSRTLLTLLAAPTVALVYSRYVRPWQLSWGATPDEVSHPLPGDELVTRPTFNATRAITIAASPEEIWPWLVQVGLTRAGWYSYDILDNLGRPSARHIIPELQNLAPGDVVPMSPDGKQGMQVHSIDEPHSMIWVHRETPHGPGSSTPSPTGQRDSSPESVRDTAGCHHPSPSRWYSSSATSG